MSEIAIRMRHERPLGFSESCACWIGASDLGLWGRGLVFGVSALHTTPYSPHPHPSPYTLHPSQSLALAASGLRVQGLWFGLWCFSESCACWFGAPGSGLRVRGLVCGVSALHTTPYTPHSTPYTLYPTPFSESCACWIRASGSRLRVRGLVFGVWALHPSPYTRRPTPHTLHPTPYNLHPTPYALNIKAKAHLDVFWGLGHEREAGRLVPDAHRTCHHLPRKVDVRLPGRGNPW
jgi:hypothetical protein